MGMFDSVRYEAPCPYCGALLSAFQSKDGPCILSTLDPDEVNGFYTSCHSCNAWVEYEVQRSNPKIVVVSPAQSIDISESKKVEESDE